MKNTETKKRVGIWVRVSTDKQKKGDSPEHHEKRARYYAEMHEYEVVSVYQLAGLSGKSVMDYRETKQMMHDIKSGNISGIIFSKLARLGRNTKELLEMADFFEKHDATLISLDESFDTSTPGGRLFYTMIAAMAQAEREETVARIQASVDIRAKLGKTLGGQAPFGYKYVDKELVLDENEAPIRKLMYELFLKYRKKSVVQKILTEKGYRSRKGNKFTLKVIDDNLIDPIAKGMRRFNYLRINPNGKGHTLKPEAEWYLHKAPRIVSDEVWDEVNAILTRQREKLSRPHRGVVHLLSGFVFCHCGDKMYVRSKTKKFICETCRNKIPEKDLNEIFQEQLHSYVVNEAELALYKSKSNSLIAEKEELLRLHKQKAKSLEEKLNALVNLFASGEIPKEGFSKHYDPEFEQLQELEDEIPQLTAEIDALKIEQASGAEVLSEAKNLYERWNSLEFKERRAIVEVIVNRVEIGEDLITIDLAYLNPPELITNSVQTGFRLGAESFDPGCGCKRFGVCKDLAY